MKNSDYFINEENYYFNAWVNGNKNHVLAHLSLFSTDTDTIIYNSIIKQFTHDEDLLNHLLNKVRLSTGLPISRNYL